MKNKILIFLLFSLPCLVKAQGYFQQEVNYTIQVTLNDSLHELNAFESMEYINNSPNTLTEIYLHLWPNAYKNDNTAMTKQLLENGETKFYYAKEGDKGFIDNLDFKVNGKSVRLVYDSIHIDIARIILPEPLKSGEKINITTPFRVKIPKGVFSRLGHMDQAYQITQWYPKPAVYDANGWNAMPYLTQGEFYSEYGSYEVSITLPKNYVVGATGDLVDGEAELGWLSAKAEATTKITSFEKNDNTIPKSDPSLKTLRYKQSKVHDFAWFADKRFHVLKGSVTLPTSKKNVTTWVMFTNKEAHLWKKSIEYMNDAIYYYSLWNGDYAYNQCTAVDGALSAGGGMEYPNVTVIGPSGSDKTLETVIMHEVGHNWFYGMLGSNEREHAWMDEGLNSYNEMRYMSTKYPTQKLIGNLADKGIGRVFDLKQYKQKSQYYFTYLFNAAKNEDQACETPSPDFTNINYGAMVYAKSALSFDYLANYLGQEKFDAIMQKYFDTWKFKHPQPADFRKIMETELGQDLSWFFNDMLGSTKKIDYKIKNASAKNKSIVLRNKGKVNGPVFIGNETGKWIRSEGFSGKKKIAIDSLIPYKKLIIDPLSVMPEIDRRNNIIRRKGIFKKVEPLRLQFVGSIENKERTQISFFPVVGWNYNNSVMAGVAVYSNVFPQQKFEYVLMPMYSTQTQDLVGSGSVAYNWFPSSTFQNIRLSAGVKRYAYSKTAGRLMLSEKTVGGNYYSEFLRLDPQIVFNFKKRKARSKIDHQVAMRSVTVFRDVLVRDTSVNLYNSESRNYTVNEIAYTLANTRAIYPYSIRLVAQQNTNFVKAMMEAKYRLNYARPKKQLDVRIFAGAFIYSAPGVTDQGNFKFRISGITGTQDYMYDYVYLDRSRDTEFFSRQFTESDGAMKTYTPLGQSSQWMMAMNLKSTLPMNIPVKLYADIASCASDGVLNQKVFFSSGVNLILIKNIVDIYVPLFVSKDIKDNQKLNKISFMETIRFTINFHLMKPFDAIRNIKL